MRESVPAQQGTIARADLPALYADADENSVRGQMSYLWITRARLLALAGAAIMGALTFERGGADWTGVGLVILFALALLLELLLVRVRPERTWYDGRAVAESAKTLAWKFMVCGRPFGNGMDTSSATDLLVKRLDEVREQFPHLHLIPRSPQMLHVTERMRATRGLALTRRKALYEAERIAAQQLWYGDRASWNEGRTSRWSWTVLLLEVIGVAGGVLKATGTLEFDLFGIAASLAAGAVAWGAVKQHSILARSYSVAAQDLAGIRSRAADIDDEESWAAFVDEAEEAISREHTTWRASRS